MAGIDDLQGSGVYESSGKLEGKGTTIETGAGGNTIETGAGDNTIEANKTSEAQEVATQGFGWSFDPS